MLVKIRNSLEENLFGRFKYFAMVYVKKVEGRMKNKR